MDNTKVAQKLMILDGRFGCGLDERGVIHKVYAAPDTISDLGGIASGKCGQKLTTYEAFDDAWPRL